MTAKEKTMVQSKESLILNVYQNMEFLSLQIKYPRYEYIQLVMQYIYTLKPRYSKYFRQTLFVHYIKCKMLSKSSKWELGFVHYIAQFTILRFIISRFECTRILDRHHAWRSLDPTLDISSDFVKKKRKKSIPPPFFFHCIFFY